MSVSVYTTVDKAGNISHLRTEIETSDYVYDLLGMSARSEGYSSFHDYIEANLSRQYGEGVTVTYNEVRSDDKVRMIIDLKGNIKQDEDSGMKVTRDGDFMVFEYRSSGSGPASPYSNYTDTSGMSDAVLNGITFDYYLEMPGNIVDSNAGVVSGNKAEWHLVGANISRTDRMYARSEIAKAPGFEAVVAILALASGAYLFAVRMKE